MELEDGAPDWAKLGGHVEAKPPWAYVDYSDPLVAGQAYATDDVEAVEEIYSTGIGGKSIHCLNGTCGECWLCKAKLASTGFVAKPCTKHPGQENHCLTGECGICWLCKLKADEMKHGVNYVVKPWELKPEREVDTTTAKLLADQYPWVVKPPLLSAYEQVVVVNPNGPKSGDFWAEVPYDEEPLPPLESLEALKAKPLEFKLSPEASEQLKSLLGMKSSFEKTTEAVKKATLAMQEAGEAAAAAAHNVPLSLPEIKAVKGGIKFPKKIPGVYVEPPEKVPWAGEGFGLPDEDGWTAVIWGNAYQLFGYSGGGWPKLEKRLTSVNDAMVLAGVMGIGVRVEVDPTGDEIRVSMGSAIPKMEVWFVIEELEW